MSVSAWADRDVPAMWSSAQAADTEMAWRQVSGWQQTYELLAHHEAHLRTGRDELATAWPPQRSPAAQAFVAYLDVLIISIGQAKEDAVANRQALNHVLTSLASAKADMAKLKSKWDEYEAEDEARSKNLSNMLPHSAGPDWRRQLNRLAGDRMTRSDQEVFEATQQMMVPIALTRSSAEEFEPLVSGSSGSSASNADPAGGKWMRAPVVSPANDDSPQLAGGWTPVPGSGAVPPGGSAVPAEPSAGHSLGLVPGAPSAVDRRTPGASPGSARPTTGGAGRNGGAAVGAYSEAHGVRSRPGPTPPGAPGGHGSGVVPGRRVNPVGGVVGNSAHAGIHGTPLAAGVSPPPERRQLRPEGEPYLQWTVEVGVPPVIEPPPERRHDPGPGVFGIDR